MDLELDRAAEVEAIAWSEGRAEPRQDDSAPGVDWSPEELEARAVMDRIERMTVRYLTSPEPWPGWEASRAHLVGQAIERLQPLERVGVVGMIRYEDALEVVRIAIEDALGEGAAQMERTGELGRV